MVLAETLRLNFSLPLVDVLAELRVPVDLGPHVLLDARPLDAPRVELPEAEDELVLLLDRAHVLDLGVEALDLEAPRA